MLYTFIVTAFVEYVELNIKLLQTTDLAVNLKNKITVPKGPISGHAVTTKLSQSAFLCILTS